jgi:stage III sporulation protein AD
MEIFQVVGLGLIAAVLVVILKEEKPEIALQVTVVVGVIIFLFMLGKINSVLTVLKNLARKANIDLLFLTTLLKIVGIAYIAEFGAQVCRDAGSNAIASKIEFAGKVLIMILAVPIVFSILELVLQIMP